MRTVTVLTTLVLAIGIANAGVLFTVESTTHDETPARVQSNLMSIHGNHLKISTLDPKDGKTVAGNEEVVFHGGRNEMMMIDHANKSYFVMDEEMFKEVDKAMGDAQKQMAEALKNMSDEERQALEQAQKMGVKIPGMPPAGTKSERQKPELKKTKDSEEMAGYKCDRYEAFSNGKKVYEFWVTDWSNIEGGAEARGAFETMCGFMVQIKETLSQGASADHFDMEMLPLEAVAEIDGFPVVTRSFENGELTSESILKSAKKSKMDPSAFDPPKGYKKKSVM